LGLGGGGGFGEGGEGAQLEIEQGGVGEEFVDQGAAVRHGKLVQAALRGMSDGKQQGDTR